MCTYDNKENVFSFVDKAKFNKWCALADGHTLLGFTISEVLKIANIQDNCDIYTDKIGKFVYSTFEEITALETDLKQSIIFKCIEYIASAPKQENKILDKSCETKKQNKPSLISNTIKSIEFKVETLLYNSSKALHLKDIKQTFPGEFNQSVPSLNDFIFCSGKVKEVLPKVYIYIEKYTDKFVESLKNAKIDTYRLITEKLDEEGCNVSEEELVGEVWSCKYINCLTRNGVYSLVQHVVHYSEDLYCSDGMVGLVTEVEKNEKFSLSEALPTQIAQNEPLTVMGKAEVILFEHKKTLHYMEVEELIFERYGEKHSVNEALSKSKNAVNVSPGVFISSIFYSDRIDLCIAKEKEQIRQLIFEEIKENDNFISISNLINSLSVRLKLTCLPKMSLPEIIRGIACDCEYLTVEFGNVKRVESPMIDDFNDHNKKSEKVEKNVPIDDFISNASSALVNLKKMHRSDKPEYFIDDKKWNQWHLILINTPFVKLKVSDIARDLKLIWPPNLDSTIIEEFIVKPFVDIRKVVGWERKKTIIVAIAWAVYLLKKDLTEKNGISVGIENKTVEVLLPSVEIICPNLEKNDESLKGKPITEKAFVDGGQFSDKDIENFAEIPRPDQSLTIDDKLLVGEIKTIEFESMGGLNDSAIITLFASNLPQQYINENLWTRWKELFRFEPKAAHTRIATIANQLELHWLNMHSSLTIREVLKNDYAQVSQEYDENLLKTIVLSLAFMVVSISNNGRALLNSIVKCCRKIPDVFQPSGQDSQTDGLNVSSLCGGKAGIEISKSVKFVTTSQANLCIDEKDALFSRLSGERIHFNYLLQFEEPWLHIDNDIWNDWKRLALARCSPYLRTDAIANRLGLPWPLGGGGRVLTNYLDWDLDDLHKIVYLKKRKTIFMEVAYFAFNCSLKNIAGSEKSNHIIIADVNEINETEVNSDISGLIGDIISDFGI